ncbi:MAG: DUF5995 family protein [Myxococcota bacterium]
MLLCFERQLPCPPSVAWSLANDPRRMNLWSLARVEVVSLGDGAHPAGVGALRRVHVPSRLRPLALDEVVVEAEPPHRFAYRVVAGVPVRRHLGRLACEPSERGTRLRWEVDIEPPNRLLGLLIRRSLVPQLERSLDRMVRAAGDADAGTALPPRRDLDEHAPVPDLLRVAEDCLAEQRSLADGLMATEAPARWFTRVYEHVTELQIAGCREGRFRHPAWVLRLIPAFHELYVRNLRAWLRREHTAVEAHWRSAFTAMEGAARKRPEPLSHLGYVVAKGMQAHIEEDLPRALAQVWARHYAGRCDYVRLRGDYLAMESVFRVAGDRLLQAIPRREWPLDTRVLHAVLPAVIKDRWTAREHYDLGRQRRKAFERGERIGRMIIPEPPTVQPSALP